MLEAFFLQKMTRGSTNFTALLLVELTWFPNLKILPIQESLDKRLFSGTSFNLELTQADFFLIEILIIFFRIPIILQNAKNIFKVCFELIKQMVFRMSAKFVNLSN